MMNRQMRKYTLLLALILLSLSKFSYSANNQGQIDALLKETSPPLGVVFEVVERDPKALDWAIPKIVEYTNLLRAKHPDIAIAVVSHGKEQFALTKVMATENANVHQEVKSLVSSDIPVQVCGTHASWYGKTAEDFPDYVEVVPAGPAAIRNYEDMGYQKIVMDRKETK